MNIQSLISRKSIAMVAVLVASLGATAVALDKSAVDQDVSATLVKFYAMNDNNKYLADHAAGILVFPKITKAGIGIGGEHGDGALQENGKTVGYYSKSGGSVGLTLGVASHSEVIIFNTPEALNKFVNGNDWNIGADASVAIMKTGASNSYDNNSLKEPVLVWIFGEKGLMGDASLKGGKISKTS
jgi:lipid-binding SYLF domain-containing protein